MSEALQTLEGWYVLHDFRSVDWASWKMVSPDERKAAMDELQAMYGDWMSTEEQKQGSTGLFSIVGHKGDLLFMHLRPSLQEINELETRFNKSKFAEFTVPTYSYVSVVELSNYVASAEVDPETDPYIQGRLKPTLPKTNHVCFYPMNKKRQGDDNWYMLSVDERRAMMRSHGMIGRSYAGRVVQVISGSVGFDDWEWGVTLFADDPITYKKLVYEMRFDEVSARFGEFGSFFVGNRITDSSLKQFLKV